METTLKISIKDCGKAAGTLGWFKAIMEDSELIIRPTKSGSPGLFQHELHRADGVERTANEGNSWICGLMDDKNGNVYQYLEGKYAKIYARDEYPCVGFTNFQLTPACEEAINKFIDESMEYFKEWFENQ